MQILDSRIREAEHNLERTESGILRFMQSVSLMKDGVNDEEVDGWLIRRPSIFEFDEHFGVLCAESRTGCTAPLVLPQSIEIVVAVLAGEVRLDGFVGDLGPQHFFVIRPKDGRNVYAVQHPTSIAAFFFRGPERGPALDSRAAA